jgi:hypothetical protein
VALSRGVPGCWVVIEWHGYHVSVVPHGTPKAARLAYQRSYNRWAKKRRVALVRNLVVYGFRVPVSDWQTIRGLVISATQ